MIELSVIRDLVAIFGVIAGFSYYVLTVRNAQRNQRMQLETRQTQLYMQLFKELYTPEFWTLYLELSRIEWENIEDFRRRIIQNDPETFAKLLSLWWTLGEMGTMLYNGLMEPYHVFQPIGEMPIIAWKKWWPLIEKLRMEWGWKYPETSYGHFDYLARRMMHEHDSIYKNVLSKMNEDIQKWDIELY